MLLGMKGVLDMILYATTNYALQIMIEVAKNGGVISSAALSERIGISQRYLKKITTRLKEAGLLRSVPGHYGGYILPEDSENLSVWDIFHAMEPNKPLIESQTDEPETGSGLAVKNLHSEMNRMLQHHFRAVSLAELVQLSEENEFYGFYKEER